MRSALSSGERCANFSGTARALAMLDASRRNLKLILSQPQEAARPLSWKNSLCKDSALGTLGILARLTSQNEEAQMGMMPSLQFLLSSFSFFFCNQTHKLLFRVFSNGLSHTFSQSTSYNSLTKRRCCGSLLPVARNRRNILVIISICVLYFRNRHLISFALTCRLNCSRRPLKASF